MVIVTKEAESQSILNDEKTETHQRSRSFENIHSNNSLKLNSPKLARELLPNALKMKNVSLTRQCVQLLDFYMDKENVLMILSHLDKCKSTGDYTPSAPPTEENQNHRDEMWLNDVLEQLRYNCYLEIDKNADVVLNQREIANLSYETLLEVVTRDSLQVTCEMLVYAAVMKWAKEECRRRNIHMQSVHLKAMLRDLCHGPRYGLMTKKEFTSANVDGEKGPMKSGVLNEVEYRRILFYIKEKQKNHEVEELPFKASRPRILGLDKPKLLSERSCSRTLRRSSFPGPCSELSNGSNKCEKVLVNMLTCWAAVFD